jgi:hypothetical protein
MPASNGNPHMGIQQMIHQMLDAAIRGKWRMV